VPVIRFVKLAAWPRAHCSDYGVADFFSWLKNSERLSYFGGLGYSAKPRQHKTSGKEEFNVRVFFFFETEAISIAPIH
jgi:hypothetical protein